MSVEGEGVCLKSKDWRKATEISYAGRWQGTVDNRADLEG